jgi:hypothetical protein
VKIKGVIKKNMPGSKLFDCRKLKSRTVPHVYQARSQVESQEDHDMHGPPLEEGVIKELAHASTGKQIRKAKADKNGKQTDQGLGKAALKQADLGMGKVKADQKSAPGKAKADQGGQVGMVKADQMCMKGLTEAEVGIVCGKNVEFNNFGQNKDTNCATFGLRVGKNTSVNGVRMWITISPPYPGPFNFKEKRKKDRTGKNES